MNETIIENRKKVLCDAAEEFVSFFNNTYKLVQLKSKKEVYDSLGKEYYHNMLRHNLIPGIAYCSFFSHLLHLHLQECGFPAQVVVQKHQNFSQVRLHIMLKVVLGSEEIFFDLVGKTLYITFSKEKFLLREKTRAEKLHKFEFLEFKENELYPDKIDYLLKSSFLEDWSLEDTVKKLEKAHALRGNAITAPEITVKREI